jgi:hypothetical protein
MGIFSGYLSKSREYIVLLLELLTLKGYCSCPPIDR